MKSKKQKKAPAAAVLPPKQSNRSHPDRVPYDRVRPDPQQPRKDFNPALLRELAESIKEQGIVHKLLVVYVPAVRIEEPDMIEKEWKAVEEGTGRVASTGSEEAVRKFAKGWQGDYYMIVDGERRWRAAGLLGLKEVPIDCRQLDDKDIRNIQLISSMQRANLSALEEAGAFVRELELRRQGEPAFSPERLGDELGIKRSTVYNRIALLRLHEPVREALTAGAISTTVAAEIASVPDRQLQLEALKRAKGDQYDPPMSFRKVQEMIKREYVRSLNPKVFHLDKVYEGEIGGRKGDEGQLATIGTCEKCPRRSGNMKAAFPDMKNPNVCTDPPCFEAKRNADDLRRLEQAKSEGLRTMTREEHQQHRGKLVSADKTCYDDREYRHWKELMGKHAPAPILVQQDDGLVEMWPVEEAMEAAKKNGIKLGRSSSGSADNASRLRGERKKRFTAVCQQAAGEILDRLVFKKGLQEKLWGLLAEELTHRCDIESHSFLAKRRGLARTIGEVRPALDKWLKAEHTVAEYQGYIVELLLCTRWNESWNVVIGKKFKSLCALARVDLKKCEQAVIAGKSGPNPVQQELAPKKTVKKKKGGGKRKVKRKK